MTNKKPIIGSRYKSKSKTMTTMEIVIKGLSEDKVHYLITNEPALEGFYFTCGLHNFFEHFEELTEDNQTDRVAKMKNIVQDGGQHKSDLGGWFKAHRDNIQLATDDISEKPKGLNKEVLEAMEELREEIYNQARWKAKSNQSITKDQLYEALGCLNIKNQNLLNALDNQSNNHQISEASIAAGEESLGAEKAISLSKESIWKPVSELRNLEDDSQILVNVYEGCFLFAYTEGEGASLICEIGTDIKIDIKNITKFATIVDFINQHNSLLDRVERLEQRIGDKK